MNRIQHGDWIPGGVLRVYSQRRGVWHFGIAGPMTFNGAMVLHASKDHGQFVMTTFDEFAEGQRVEYTWLPPSFGAQQTALARAKSQLGKPYRLADANCEDYVNWIVTGVARSPQREVFVLGGLAALVIACIIGG